MKRILIVCANGDSPLTGFAVRVLLIAKSLSEIGYRVYILRLYPAFRSQASWRSVLEGSSITLIEVPVPPSSRFQILKPLTTLLSSIATHLISRLNKIDLIQAEAHEAAYSVLKYNLIGLPVVVDFHGAAPEEAEARNRKLPANRNAHLWLEKAEKICVEKSNALLVVSPKMIQHLNQKHVVDVGSKSYLVPINVSDDFVDDADRSEMRKQLSFGDDDIVYVYSGGAQEYQCIQQTLYLFSLIRARDNGAKLLVLTGDKAHFISLISNNFPNLMNVVSVYTLKSREVYRYLVAADIAFLLRKNEVLNIVSCPTKFGEYLMAGLPVITTPYSGHAPDIVKAHSIGVTTNLDSDDSAKIVAYSHSISPADRARCKSVAAQELNWSKSLTQLLKCHNSVLNSKKILGSEKITIDANSSSILK